MRRSAHIRPSRRNRVGGSQDPLPGSAVLPLGSVPLPPGAGPSMALRTMTARAPGRVGAGGFGHPPPTPRRSRRRRKRQPEETKILRQLRERSAADWIRVVKKLRTPSVRAHVSAVILFDWLYDAVEPWKKNRGPLDFWASGWAPETCPGPKVLAKALVKVGYPPREAEVRSRIGE